MASLSPADVTWMELEGLERGYENAGLVATVDGGFTVLAGSGLGGGTKINWWARQSALQGRGQGGCGVRLVMG